MNKQGKGKALSHKERFEKYFKKSKNPDACWVWQGGKLGLMGYGSLRNEYGRQEAAHRQAYRLYVREIPQSMCVLHRCDNPPCVNPQHLFLGTKMDNTQDMVRKGRGGHWKHNVRGENNPNSKLSAKDKNAIKNHLLSGGLQKEMAAQLGVNVGTIKTACKKLGLKKRYRRGWVLEGGVHGHLL